MYRFRNKFISSLPKMTLRRSSSSPPMSSAHYIDVLSLYPIEKCSI